jgi:hypothetical protein
MKKTGASYGIAILIAVLFALFMSNQRFAGPPPVNAGSGFDAERALGRLQRILGDERPHPVDSDANDAVRDRLLAEIEALGFEPIVRDDFQCWNLWGAVCARVRNVLFWVTEPGPDAVMLASHYDSVPAGPGAADDGAGVAASLEIAAILKERAPARPVLALITDGEESGLIGARAFVERDPLAKEVGAVVNMEARGVSGEAMMFQTGRPNERDIAALVSGGGRLPSASSLDADIYELLPNDTDLTLFLTLDDVEAANFAFANGARFYHTPKDNIAHLDLRSLNHLGESGLRAAEAFLGQKTDEPERQLIYTDVFGMWAIAAPQLWGAVMIAVGGVFALALFFLSVGAPLRSAAAPLLALVAGVALAIGTTLLAAAIRPETSFGAANPWALRAAQLAAGFFGAWAVYGFVAPASSRNRLLAAAWFWFAAIGAAAYAVAPGSAILFAPPLLLFSIAAAASLAGASLAARIASSLGAFVFTLLVLPLAAYGEIGLFIENAAPFAILPLFAFVFAAPLCAPAEGTPSRARLVTLGAAAGALVAAFVLTLIVPAYSEAAPRHLSITHVAGADMPEAYWALPAGDAPPAEMAAIASFTKGKVEGLPGERYLAPAPAFPTSGVALDMTGDETSEDARRVRFSISAPDADALWMPLPGGVSVDNLKVNGAEAGSGSLFCAGRSCRRIELEFTLKAGEETPALYLWALEYGLGPEGAALQSARPDWAVPIQMGDIRAYSARLPL